MNLYDRAIESVDRRLQKAVAFLKLQGMIHSDAHFDNIQAYDGRLNFSDFGLATSFHFELFRASESFLTDRSITTAITLPGNSKDGL